MHAVQARLARLALVDLELLPVAALGRDQGAATHQAARLVEQRALRVVAHRHLARAPALGRRALQPDARTPIVARGPELDRLLPAQPERRLQAQRHRDVRVLDERQLLRIEHGAAVLVRHVLAVGDAELAVGGHHARAADPPRPPADVRGPVLHCSDRAPLALPLLDQRHHVLAPEPGRPQPLEAELVQGVRGLRQRVGARRARAVGAVVVRLLQALEVEVQVAHRSLRGDALRIDGNRREGKIVRMGALARCDLEVPDARRGGVLPWTAR